MRLEARDLSKRYGSVPVLSGVSLEVAAGEVRAIVGENGAGKSTLIKIISGAVTPDTGSVAVDDVPLAPGAPLAARGRGVSVVYQELTVVPDLTVAENIFLGRERGRPFLDRRAMRAEAQRLLDGLGVSLDARRPVRGLNVAHQQMVEIARALGTDAKLLMLDEPSAALAPGDVNRLLAVLRQLQDRGLAILYVSHRLDEVFSIADSTTVLRDGRHVVTAETKSFTRDGLIRQMVGRDLHEEFPARTPQLGPPVLEVTHLAARPRVRDVSLTVRAGEIVGLAGLVGAGRSSAALAMIGAIGPLGSDGSIRLGGESVKFRSPQEAIAGGVAYVTEDRKARGLFAQLGVDDNITMAHLGACMRRGLLSPARQRARAEAAIRGFDIRVARVTQPAATLSGGNQQKVLLARYLVRPPRVLIVDEPTRGVDVGARVEIYRTLNRLTAEGLGILMISSDLSEVIGMSDRVVVMRDGRTTGEVGRADATPERVMALAAH